MNKEVKNYKYLICEFSDSLNAEGMVDIDIVPRTWITYSECEKTCLTPYPEPPYTKKVLSFFQSQVKLYGLPLPSWPNWAVVIKGDADTYTQAEHRANRLRKEAYAFTTSDNIDYQKAANLTNTYCQRSLEEIMKVPVIKSTSEESNPDTSWESCTDNAFMNKKNFKLKASKKKTDNKLKKKINLNIRKQLRTTAKPNFIVDENALENNLENFEIITDNELIVGEEVVANKIKDSFTNNSQELSNKLIKPVTKTNFNVEKTKHLSDIVEQKIDQSFDDSWESNKQIVQQHTKIKNPTQKIKFSSERVAILTAIKNLKLVILETQVDLKQIKEKMFGSQENNLLENLSKYNLSIPIDNIVDWNIFDNQIKNDADLRNSFETKLQFHLDKSGSNVTNCYLMIRDVVTGYHRDRNGDSITESVFNSALSACIGNSKDWGGRI